MDQLVYEQFLKTKLPAVQSTGLTIAREQINPTLFDWQRDIVQWAVGLGCAAVFAECGLGKTFMQIEWARLVAEQTGGRVLLLAPLSVASQTIREGEKLGVALRYCRNQAEADASQERLIITNYEMLPHFDPDAFVGVVLDESSILKAYTGQIKQRILRSFAHTPYRLACTATPAPNDYLELGNHLEFLGVMDSSEMIARWFINDSMNAGGYRLKGHARDDFWRFIASVAACISKPSDLGYPDDGFELPALEVVEHLVGVDHSRAHEQGRLYFDGNLSSTEMWADKRATLEARCAHAAGLVQVEPGESWVIWYDTIQEAELLQTLIPGAVVVQGSDKPEVKEARLVAFAEGRTRVLITHGKIAAFGMNWQHCARMIAMANFSFERLYQMIRRFWRFGQQRPVNVHMIVAESETGVLANIRTKQKAHQEMQAAMSAAMREGGLGAQRETFALSAPTDIASGRNWALYLGDCVLQLANVRSRSVDLSVFSPPFALLYIYSALLADMGNCADKAEFVTHYSFLCRELARVLKPGKHVAVHCKDLPLYKGRDGAMGLDDFPGDLIRAHEREGLLLVEWLTVWKDPVIEMQRTKNAGLLWSDAFCKDSARCRQGMADYVLIFQKVDTPPACLPHSPLPQSVVARCADLWLSPGERLIAPGADDGTGPAGLIVSDAPVETYTDEWLASWLLPNLLPGRNLVAHVCDPRQMHPLIARLAPHQMIFHSRVALTDGTWLVVFRKWCEGMDATPAITHELTAEAHDFIGSDGPRRWKNDRDYSIQVWQRYASPVWYDLEGLPISHPNIFMNIQQTNVLNARVARDNEDEKHICPLQLDLIEVLLRRYSQRGDLILSPFAGIGSEGVVTLQLGRSFVGVELKESYWRQAIKFLEEAELKNSQLAFDFAEVAA